MGAKPGKELITPVSNIQNSSLNSEAHCQIPSPADLQKEFDDIYKRSNSMLRSLVKNPCKELENRIIESIQGNPLRLSKHFREMEAYQTCVNEDFAMEMLEKMAILKEN